MATGVKTIYSTIRDISANNSNTFDTGSSDAYDINTQIQGNALYFGITSENYGDFAVVSNTDINGQMFEALVDVSNLTVTSSYYITNDGTTTQTVALTLQHHTSNPTAEDDGTAEITTSSSYTAGQAKTVSLTNATTFDVAKGDFLWVAISVSDIDIQNARIGLAGEEIIETGYTFDNTATYQIQNLGPGIAYFFFDTAAPVVRLGHILEEYDYFNMPADSGDTLLPWMWSDFDRAKIAITEGAA